MHNKTIKHAKTARETNSPVQGVKGASPFLFLPTFDIIRCMVPDYMHGVFRSFKIVYFLTV